jgi:hypothetical protein
MTPFVGQVARVLTGADDGVLRGSRILICDRDIKWSATFRRTLADALESASARSVGNSPTPFIPHIDKLLG